MKVIELNILKTKVMDWNAAYYGVDIYEWMKRAGRGIAKVISNFQFPISKSRLKVAFFCGTGNNGGDGFAAARFLHNPPLSPLKLRGEVKGGYEPVVFLFGSPRDIRTEEAKRHWREMVRKDISYKLIKNKRDLPPLHLPLRKGEKVWEFDIIVDCLLGTGAKGKLREPIASAVKLFNKLKAFKVVVDVPTPGIKKFDLAISMQFPKVKGVEVVDLKPDPKFMSKIGPGEVKALSLPKPSSHKGDNGRLLIIAGSQRFHGSLIYAVKIASRIVDLIYVLSTKENQHIISKLKIQTAEFIPVKELKDYLDYVDCVLIGPGMGKSSSTKKLVEKSLKCGNKVVLDADALNVLDEKLLKLLGPNHILTPHKREFERLINLPTSPQPSPGLGREKGRGRNVDKFVNKYHCTVVLKGKVDVVANPDWDIKYNYTGNEGMTKGGTGDVLAGLIAAFYCRNDAYLSAAAGVFINGLAGDELYKKVGPFYNAEDLVNQIPITFKAVIARNERSHAEGRSASGGQSH